MSLVAAIVDDNEVDRYLTKRVLRRSGLFESVTDYSSAEEFVEDYSRDDDLAEANASTVILLDINMPGIGGFGVLDRLAARVDSDDAEQGANDVVFLLTASCSDKDIERALDFDCVAGYFEKPIDANKLGRLVEQALPTASA